MMNEFFEITYEEWLEKFKPEFEGIVPYLWHNIPEGTDPRKIWTRNGVKGDGWISSGKNSGTKLGYYITEIPVTDGDEYSVKLDMTWEDDE
jgi:hypothetical protein